MTFGIPAVSSLADTQTTGGVRVTDASVGAPGSPSPTVGGELDDATLVARAREGDLGAFEALVGRYQRKIYQLAVRMTRSSADAEDVTQEVFLTAWRRLPQLEQDAAFVGWLYRTASNRCLNLLRGRRPEQELDVDTTADNAPDADPGRAAVATAQMRALSLALGELTAEQRAVWLLREVHGRPYEEIARLVGTTPDGVRGRLARARAHLAEVMAPWR